MRRTGNKADSSSWLVFVDGVQQEWCMAADDEEGWAEVTVRDSAGHAIPTGVPPWNVETRMVWGKVEFRPNPAAMARKDGINADPICRPPVPGTGDQEELVLRLPGRIIWGGPLTSPTCRVRREPPC